MFYHMETRNWVMTKIFQIYKVVDLGTWILWFSTVEKNKTDSNFYMRLWSALFLRIQADATGNWESTTFFSYLHFEFNFMGFFTLATAY